MPAASPNLCPSFIVQSECIIDYIPFFWVLEFLDVVFSSDYRMVSGNLWWCLEVSLLLILISCQRLGKRHAHGVSFEEQSQEIE